MGYNTARHRVSLDPDDLALLMELASTAKQMAKLAVHRAELIDQCIAAGHSERAIGQAAGLTGPAINQRKKRRDS